ncbi:hypothetical protein D3C81_1420970 [compost metagenome]
MLLDGFIQLFRCCGIVITTIIDHHAQGALTARLHELHLTSPEVRIVGNLAKRRQTESQELCVLESGGVPAQDIDFVLA